MKAVNFRRALLACAVAWLAPCAPAQTSASTAMPARVGWLQLSHGGGYSELTERGFLAGLREAGYVEGQNLTLVRRSAHGDTRKLRALAREIVAAKVDVIFAPAKPMADAAWYASRKIATVIATVTDPVVVEYAVSLARPGKHITGVTTANAELIGKRLQLLTELVTGITRVGTPIDPDLLDSCVEELRLMEQAAKQLGVTIVPIPVTDATLDADEVVRRAISLKVQALMTAPMTTNLEYTDKLARAATRQKLPFVHDIAQFAPDALAVYGPDFEDIFRRAGHYVARILKGERPAEMAIEEPKQFKLIVNQRTARALGLAVPPAVLLRADQVIE